MTHSVFYAGGPIATCVEITNSRQSGPLGLAKHMKPQLDYTNAGHMLFMVDLVAEDGNRLTLLRDASYETAIIKAEKAGIFSGVPVNDLVAAGV